MVGSRGSSVDTTINDQGEDASGYGFPPALASVFNLTNIAEGGAPIISANKHLNYSMMAEGLVGEHLPVVVFYYPVATDSPYLPNSSTVHRYWTMVASGVPDMEGSREQGVWFRFQQVGCAGADMAPPCDLLGKPLYFDTFWWSSSLHANTSSGPVAPASGSGFYGNLLQNRAWWDRELANEGMLDVHLPESSGTNGTWLNIQARHSIVRSMITRQNVWEPRAGALTIYNMVNQHELCSDINLVQVCAQAMEQRCSMGNRMPSLQLLPLQSSLERCCMRRV